LAHLICDVPITYCLVRDEFLYDQKDGFGAFTECALIGAVGLPGRVPTFTAMLKNGALWARLPLHAFCVKPCDPLPVSTLCLWDCLSYDVTAHAYHFLGTLRADVFCCDGIERPGQYIFSLDWCRSEYAELPDQHKQHHLIALDEGQIAAMPGNRLRWHEPSWIKPFDERPKYKVNSHEWSAERSRALSDGGRWAYTLSPAPANGAGGWFNKPKPEKAP